MKRLFLVALCLALAGCDDSEARYQKTLKKYEALIDTGKLPKDPAFDDVLHELEANKSEKAQKLAQAIKDARGTLPPRPLATAHGEGGGTADPLGPKRAECESLAREFGSAPDAGKEAARVKLLACREELERLDAQLVHAAEPGSDGGGESLLSDKGLIEQLRIECAHWRAYMQQGENVDVARYTASLQLNADKLKMLGQPPGPCAQ